MKHLNSILAAATLIFTLAACSMLSSGPSRTVKEFYNHVDAGELDAAMKNLSKTAANGMGSEKMKAMLEVQTRAMKAKGGVSSIDVQKEDVTGETAEVTGTLKFKNGDNEAFHTKLIKEDGVWKISAS
jgi:hypothetical protein